MTDSDRVVRWEKSEGIAHVWLCNAAKRNAMGQKFFEQLPEVMREVNADETVRAVVLAAEGPAFTVGLDLFDMGGTLAPSGGQIETRRKILADVDRLQRSISSVADCPVPTIAVMHGWCIGGGVDLVTGCDIRLASADMKLSVRETKIAIVADLGTLQRLPKIIAPGHVAELAYTGKDITAARAKEIGLVNEIHADFDQTWRRREAWRRRLRPIRRLSCVVSRRFSSTATVRACRMDSTTWRLGTPRFCSPMIWPRR